MFPTNDPESWREDPVIGRAFVTGCAVGASVAFAGIAAAALVGGLGLGASIGLGVFGAFWGGLGFGGMMGGAAGLIQAERVDAARVVVPPAVPPTPGGRPGAGKAIAAFTPASSVVTNRLSRLVRGCAERKVLERPGRRSAASPRWEAFAVGLGCDPRHPGATPRGSAPGGEELERERAARVDWHAVAHARLIPAAPEPVVGGTREGPPPRAPRSLGSHQAGDDDGRRPLRGVWQPDSLLQTITSVVANDLGPRWEEDGGRPVESACQIGERLASSAHGGLITDAAQEVNRGRWNDLKEGEVGAREAPHQA